MADAPTWPVAAGSLILGFAVAEITGVRPIGGIVLVAAMVWCGLRWLAARGPGLTAALVVLYLAMFALSHVRADAIGAWPAVLIVSAIVGASTWAVADRTRPPGDGVVT